MVDKYIASLLKLLQWYVLCAFDFSLRVLRRYNCTMYERQINWLCFKVWAINGLARLVILKCIGMENFRHDTSAIVFLFPSKHFLLFNPNLWDPYWIKFLLLLNTSQLTTKDWILRIRKSYIKLYYLDLSYIQGATKAEWIKLNSFFIIRNA